MAKDRATVNCMGKMHWFELFQNVVLYCQTVKCDWNEVVQDKATVNCSGKITWFGMFQKIVQYCQTVKKQWNELAQDRETVNFVDLGYSRNCYCTVRR